MQSSITGSRTNLGKSRNSFSLIYDSNDSEHQEDLPGDTGWTINNNQDYDIYSSR